MLGDEADSFVAAYGVTRHGNFEGKNILEFVGDMSLRPSLAEARRRLFEAREQRVHPGRDEKVLTSWIGLMLAAFAEAARAFNRDDCRQAARRNAECLLRELRQDNGRLLRSWKNGEVTWLQALSYALSKPPEIAIVGDPHSADTQSLLNIVRDGHQPSQVVVLGALSPQSAQVPLLQNRGLLDGIAAAYLCRDFACQAPITEQEVLQVQLEHR